MKTQGVEIFYDKKNLDTASVSEWVISNTTPDLNEVTTHQQLDKLTAEKTKVVSVVLFTPSTDSAEFKAFSRASQIEYQNVEFLYVTNQQVRRDMNLRQQSAVFVYKTFDQNISNCELTAINPQSIR
jgi:hypothetical protein